MRGVSVFPQYISRGARIEAICYTVGSRGQRMHEGTIMTVQGPISPNDITAMVPHEHVLHSFGKPPTTNPRYDADHVRKIALPALRGLRAEGCNALAECTTEYFGRAPGDLRALSEESGVYIITNTGYYGAAGDRYVPEHAYRDNAEELAERWSAEWENGIHDSGVRPGFIKIGVDHPAPLSEIDTKLVRAAALTHLATGLVIEVHSPKDGALGGIELDILAGEGVDPSAWIWVHADTVEDVDAVVGAAERGAWVEFDSLRKNNLDERLGLLRRFKAEGHLDHVLLSHDESSYLPDRTEPIPTHVTLFTDFVPMLRENGFTDEEIHRLTVANPRRAFTVARRRGPRET